MQKVHLMHMCLLFEYKHKKYVYGLTYSILTSNYLVKYRPDILIIPSMPYVECMFMHAGLDDLFARILNRCKNESEAGGRKAKACEQQQKKQQATHSSLLEKIAKKIKLVASDEKGLKFQYSHETINELHEKGQLVRLGEHELEQVRLIDIFKQLVKQETRISSQGEKFHQHNNGSRISLISWINNPVHELRLMVTETGTTTYISQGNHLLVVDPSEQYMPYLRNNSIVKPHSKQEGKHTDGDRDSVPCLLSLMHTVIVTKISSVASVLALMITQGVEHVRVLVVSQELEMSLVDKAHRYLHMPEEIVRSRLLIRNIGIAHTHMQNQHHKLRKYPIFNEYLNPYTLQSPSTLSCVWQPLSQNSPQMLELQFGSSIDLLGNKKILFYAAPAFMTSEACPETEITYMPVNLQSKHIEFVVMYRVGDELGKQLKALPQQLRKKIILNRNQHKYNHKYYYTFEKNKIQSCTITDTQYITLVSAKAGKSSQPLIGLRLQDKQIKHKSIDRDRSLCSTQSIEVGCKIYEMRDHAEIQTVGQAVQVLDGYVVMYYHHYEEKKEKMEIVGRGGRVIDNSYRVVALKHAQIKMMLCSDYQIMTQYSKLQALSHIKQEQQTNSMGSLLITNINPSTTKDTSISNRNSNINQSSASTATITAQPKYVISSLLNIQHLSGIEENTLIAQLTLAQKQLLNSICHPITYEVGFKTNNHNENIYFISKGGMKWENSDRVAGNGHFIGDLLSFYEMRYNQEYEFQNYIQVIKDTWAVRINIEEFHKYFILKNPHLLYKMFHQGKIFN